MCKPGWKYSTCAFQKRWNKKNPLNLYNGNEDLRYKNNSNKMVKKDCRDYKGNNHSSSNFQALLSLYQSFGDRAERTGYDWYHYHFHVPDLF